MNKQRLIDLLKEGETLYINYNSGLIIFGPKVRPGTKDNYTHCLYLNKKTGFFYQFEKESQRTEYIEMYDVQNILNDLEKERREVQRFLGVNHDFHDEENVEGNGTSAH